MGDGRERVAWRDGVGEGQEEERGWAYRRRQLEGAVLYEAVRDHLATLLAEASEMRRGLPQYVERDFVRYLECGVAGASVSGKPHEVPRRLRARRQTAAILCSEMTTGDMKAGKVFVTPDAAKP
jgi:hypothetical protein